MSADGSFFVDTNVLLYEMDTREGTKQEIAARWLGHLWRTRRGRISWQVLNELYSNAIRKLPIPISQARRTVRDLMRWRPIATDLKTLERSWHWMDHAQISYWDALILAAAEQSACRYILSEDFQSGRKFGDVTVVNPFEQAPAEFGLSN